MEVVYDESDPNMGPYRDKILRPVGPQVMLIPIKEERIGSGQLFGAEARHPESGWIYSVGDGCDERLEPGDFACFEEHGFDAQQTSQDTFVIRFGGADLGDHVRVDIDVEPVVRQHYGEWRRTKEDRKIVVKDLNHSGETVSFLASDILDFQLGTYTETGFSSSYRHYLVLDRLSTGLPHDLIIVPEREIMFTIPEEFCI